MHEILNIPIKDWKSFYEKYTSCHLKGSYGRFLLRQSREENLKDFLNDLARAYKTSQRQHKNWRKIVWFPLLNEIQKLAENNKIILHAKPTHDYTGDQNRWWKYTYSKPESYGWSYHFDWIDEPEGKINLGLGTKLYNLDRYQRKYSNRSWALERLLERYLDKYIYSIYNYKWLEENRFSEKLIKFSLLGDEYWYRISNNKNGVAVWENFIWQQNKIESIELTK